MVEPPWITGTEETGALMLKHLKRRRRWHRGRHSDDTAREVTDAARLARSERRGITRVEAHVVWWQRRLMRVGGSSQKHRGETSSRQVRLDPVRLTGAVLADHLPKQLDGIVLVY
jgi:hypothetical protein